MRALIPVNMLEGMGHTVLEAVNKSSLQGVKRKHRNQIYDLQLDLYLYILFEVSTIELEQ